MDEDGGSNREANLKEAVRFWRAWKTVHQMCKDRVRRTQYLPSIPVACHHAVMIDVGCAVAVDGALLRQSKWDANRR